MKPAYPRGAPLRRLKAFSPICPKERLTPEKAWIRASFRTLWRCAAIRRPRRLTASGCCL